MIHYQTKKWLNIFSALLLVMCVPSFAESTKDRLFKGAYLAQASAKLKGAEFLAPYNFATGNKALAAAEKLYAKKKPVGKVQVELVKAIGFYETAKVATRKAKEKLANVLKARVIATGVHAEKFSGKDWKKAEKILEKAIDELEDDKLSSALHLADKAIVIYKATELVAIKSESLDETRKLIKEADEARLSKHAPITLRKAKELLATAEVELTENRYDVDLPRSLAQEARYEVKHAFYLAEHIKEVRKRNLTTEQIILKHEEPLQKVAAAADINARFDAGFSPVADSMVDYIETLNKDIQKYKQQLSDKDLQITGLTELMNEYAQLYGGVGTSVADMEKHIAEQEALLQKVDAMESMFKRGEARIFRDSREIYIRLVQLSFASGSANIDTANYDVLGKVIAAIELMPNSRIIVEGHTDSFGSDDANLILSKNRAESVRTILINHSALSSSRIEAIGFGETRPFANNDTRQGRALNRRIDIRILP